MMRRTHAAAGLMLGFGLGAFQPTPLPQALILACITEVAALLPDWDLKFKIKHRTLTHSLLLLTTLTLLIHYAAPVLALPFALGYGSHLVLDMLTIQGIELFYPSHRRIRVLKFRTGGRIDAFLAVGCLCGALYLFVPQILRLP